MRKDRSHLELVEACAPLPSIEAVGGPKFITVHMKNVRPGQVCEILHNGMMSLSHRVVVAEDADSITIASFALKQGEYQVSLRLYGQLDCVTDSQTVVVGEQLPLLLHSRA